jgi:hypothetical protein
MGSLYQSGDYSIATRKILLLMSRQCLNLTLRVFTPWGLCVKSVLWQSKLHAKAQSPQRKTAK